MPDEEGRQERASYTTDARAETRFFICARECGGSRPRRAPAPWLADAI